MSYWNSRKNCIWSAGNVSRKFATFNMAPRVCNPLVSIAVNSYFILMKSILSISLIQIITAHTGKSLEYRTRRRKMSSCLLKKSRYAHYSIYITAECFFKIIFIQSDFVPRRQNFFLISAYVCAWTFLHACKMYFIL